MTEAGPRVGIGVLVCRDGKILLGKRINAHGDGEWGGPGGHLEFGETIEACAARETREECGIELQNVRPIALSDLRWPEKHYIDIGVCADWKSGEPDILEPEKCAEWKWFDPADIPKNLFGGTRFYMEAVKTGKWYFGTKHNQ